MAAKGAMAAQLLHAAAAAKLVLTANASAADPRVVASARLLWQRQRQAGRIHCWRPLHDGSNLRTCVCWIGGTACLASLGGHIPEGCQRRGLL
jgi:hypothetical protein